MAIDLTEVYKNYQGKWVALKDDEKTVVGFGDDAREALEMAKKKGHDAILMYVSERTPFNHTHFHPTSD